MRADIKGQMKLDLRAHPFLGFSDILVTYSTARGKTEQADTKNNSQEDWGEPSGS
jgi:hypothetical protein